MGEVRVQVLVEGPPFGGEGKQVSLEMLADTGATLPVVGRDVLKTLGVRSVRKVEVEMADGRKVEADSGNAEFTINGDRVISRVVFGEAGVESLLGLTVLEQLGLAVDPIRRNLVPSRFLLKHYLE